MAYRAFAGEPARVSLTREGTEDARAYELAEAVGGLLCCTAARIPSPRPDAFGDHRAFADAILQHWELVGAFGRIFRAAFYGRQPPKIGALLKRSAWLRFPT